MARITDTTTSGKNGTSIAEPKTLVPQLADDGITQADLETAIRVLQAVGKLNHRKNHNSKKRKLPPTDENGDVSKESTTSSNGEETEAKLDGLELYKRPNLRPFRKALAGCLELHKRTMFSGKEEEEHYEQRKLGRSLKRQKMAEASLQKKHIADTALRKGRVERLNNLKTDAKEEEESKLKLLAMMVPDGHVETTNSESRGMPLLLKDGGAETGDTEPTSTENIKLPKCRSCYVCKIRYRDLHHFYDQLCPSCADQNWEKRHQTADMTGRVAIVTGSRVKIGFQTCLKLLRAGATVVATTRFPNAAADVYRKEDDFLVWKDRLQIYGLDLRDVTGLEAFTRFLKMTYSNGIDVLINNACQTIRRPRGFYVPLVEKEQKLWQESDEIHKAMLQGCMKFESVRRRLHHQHNSGSGSSSSIGQRNLEASAEGAEDAPLLLMGMEKSNGENPDNSYSDADKGNSQQQVVIVAENRSESSQFETSGLSHSAAMSQMVILPEDVGVSDDILPPGMSDINGHQLDLRSQNSWLLKMEEVSTPEVMECMFINAIAPFVLNSRLKPLMTIPQDDANRPDRFVINVSAMEGKFYRYKMANHPHTNMAKAALNMMTRTSAEDLAKKHRIFMNSVDTGWINDENPLEKASKIATNNLFQTPIDEVDAASRILDPVFSGINGGRDFKKDYGKFLKDYRETEW